MTSFKIKNHYIVANLTVVVHLAEDCCASSIKFSVLEKVVLFFCSVCVYIYIHTHCRRLCKTTEIFVTIENVFFYLIFTLTHLVFGFLIFVYIYMYVCIYVSEYQISQIMYTIFVAFLCRHIMLRVSNSSTQ